jgi:glycosyltransferase involved in cell wall biosynthesis
MFKFYLTDRSINEATTYYLSLIERAIVLIGSQSERIFSVSKIEEKDVVITIEAKDFFMVQLLKPKNKKINWFQGITPEEAKMMNKTKLHALAWEMFERVALKKSILNLFVSEAMQQHYYRKYGYSKSNYIVVPCYNALLNYGNFYTEEKYINPRFVYAGTLSKWQCIDQILNVFKIVQTLLPNAELKILTSEQEKGKLMVEQLKIKNVQVKYVPFSHIGEELKKYKYGFLIREDHIVNAVATPTKMSTYLANGVIPIFSNVVSAFVGNIDLGEYELRIPAEWTAKQIAQNIVGFEKHIVVNPEKLFGKCQYIFNEYYNDQYNTQQLATVLKDYLKN